MFLILDAEKMFDNLIWPFLLNALQNIGCSPIFWNCLHSIYLNQETKILINENLTEAI